MKTDCSQALLDFISASPTPWHAVETLRTLLENEGYLECREAESWKLLPGGKYYVCRGGSSLIAFRIPRSAPRGFMLWASHTDSPSFQLKGLGTTQAAGCYAQLNVEPYGGMLMAPWLDRPLSVAGRVVVREGDRLVTRLVNLDRDLVLIPNLAIHMDRGANENKHYDPKTDLLPLAGIGEDTGAFSCLVAEAAGVGTDALLTADLRLYPRTPGTVWGMEGEFISSPRLDDLQCVFAGVQGFLAARESGSVPVFCAFDNEEVGSLSMQGADSTFLGDTLHRLCEGLGEDERRLFSQSLLVSADNAHAVHPNHPEYADREDRPVPNGGVVVKFNAARRYTSDAVSAALFEEICRRREIPVQHYSNRADLKGGSTLGSISLSQVSVLAVDIGLAQLAMHSCYETAGAKDTAWLIEAAEGFFSSSLCLEGDSCVILEEGREGK